jgi:23S rRNA (cytosine1962-C5)-methyltransferase
VIDAESLVGKLERALGARVKLLDEPAHETACRLFAGFFEGEPALAIDLYATTLVVHNYAEPPEAGTSIVREAGGWFRERLPWLRAGVVKSRHATDPAQRRGELWFGSDADIACEVREHGVRYAIDPRMNRDCGFYLDTRNLRRWLIERSRGRTVLNAFAYTGSLGIAALAGGAREVVQLDANARFLEVAQASCTLNGLPVVAENHLAGDFWRQVAHFKRAGRRFDCVILDPPFFATSGQGTVDLAKDSTRLINKVRPLINDGGQLVAVNNALFLSGRDYLAALERLCVDGYLEIAELIPVPEDFTGYASTRANPPVTDPAPFNHATKIAVLNVRRKSV